MKEKDASKWSNWRGVRNKLENIFATERYDDWWGTSLNLKQNMLVTVIVNFKGASKFSQWGVIIFKIIFQKGCKVVEWTRQEKKCTSKELHPLICFVTSWAFLFDFPALIWCQEVLSLSSIQRTVAHVMMRVCLEWPTSHTTGRGFRTCPCETAWFRNTLLLGLVKVLKNDKNIGIVSELVTK